MIDWMWTSAKTGQVAGASSDADIWVGHRTQSMRITLLILQRLVSIPAMSNGAWRRHVTRRATVISRATRHASVSSAL